MLVHTYGADQSSVNRSQVLHRDFDTSILVKVLVPLSTDYPPSKRGSVWSRRDSDLEIAYLVEHTVRNDIRKPQCAAKSFFRVLIGRRPSTMFQIKVSRRTVLSETSNSATPQITKRDRLTAQDLSRSANKSSLVFAKRGRLGRLPAYTTQTSP